MIAKVPGGGALDSATGNSASERFKDATAGRSSGATGWPGIGEDGLWLSRHISSSSGVCGGVGNEDPGVLSSCLGKSLGEPRGVWVTEADGVLCAEDCDRPAAGKGMSWLRKLRWLGGETTGATTAGEGEGVLARGTGELGRNGERVRRSEERRVGKECRN